MTRRTTAPGARRSCRRGSPQGALPREASPAKEAKNGQHNENDDDDSKPGQAILSSEAWPTLRRADPYSRAGARAHPPLPLTERRPLSRSMRSYRGAPPRLPRFAVLTEQAFLKHDPAHSADVKARAKLAPRSSPLLGEFFSRRLGALNAVVPNRHGDPSPGYPSPRGGQTTLFSAPVLRETHSGNTVVEPSAEDFRDASRGARWGGGGRTERERHRDSVRHFSARAGTAVSTSTSALAL